MRFILIHIIIYVTASLQAQSQTLAFNHCDSAVLTRHEYEKCKGDTIFNSDILVRVNYITFLKTELLPKYRIQRQALIIPNDIRKDVKRLKSIYDSTVAFKVQRMAGEMDRNQNYVQPKAYVSSLLALETFKFYPDVYAVLLNEIHLSLNPKTSSDKMKQIEKLIHKVYASMNTLTKDKIHQIASALTKERKAFIKDYPLDMFQGDIGEEQRKRYNVINFLLWTE